MSVKLNEEDRRAIDLLFDRQRAVARGGTVMSPDGNSGGFSPHAAPVSQERVAGVQMVMNLLDQLPDEEPPAGLVERTLARIEQSADPADRPAYRAPSLDTTAHA